MTPPDALPVPSRRALLRGAAVGGAVLWTAPVVQVVSMTSASAQMTSAPVQEVEQAAPASPLVPVLTGALPERALLLLKQADEHFGYRVTSTGLTAPDAAEQLVLAASVTGKKASTYRGGAGTTWAAIAAGTTVVVGELVTATTRERALVVTLPVLTPSLAVTAASSTGTAGARVERSGLTLHLVG